MMESWDEGDDWLREGEVVDYCFDYGFSCWNVNGILDDVWSLRLFRLFGFFLRRLFFDIFLIVFVDV